MSIKKNKKNRIWVEFSLKDYREHKFLQNDYHADFVSIERKGKSKVITVERYVRLVNMMKQKRAEMKAAKKIELSSVQVNSQAREVRV